MKTEKITPGMIIKMTDHSNMGKSGERNCHNYIIIGYSYDKWIGNYQCMCITSMQKKQINWEVPIVVEDAVGYIVTDNIHSFTESEIKNGKTVGFITSNRKISVNDFLILLHDMHLMRNIGFIGEERYNDIVSRFDTYCRNFQMLYSETKEYRYIKSGVACTFDARYKYKPSPEVCSVLQEINGEQSTIASEPTVQAEQFSQEEPKPEIVEIPVKKKKKPSPKRSEGRTRKPRIMDGDDLVILNLLETQAPRMISKWDETNIRRARELGEKYSAVTIQANSKRWKSLGSWNNVMKNINSMNSSETPNQEMVNRDFCLPVSNWSDEKIRQFLDDTVNHTMTKRALCKYTKIPNYGDAKNFVVNVRKYADAHKISY